ncbi:MAG: glycosyltransferase family 2 protein [Candidatus Omnitrophica bacterium]|nr:glycosyltransferase family 2 protein [Candidatus Omnitrophota bacterium]MDD5435953.1 glycosyltransferase family 2 protein [Candidatus Omnitrophota bacterium]
MTSIPEREKLSVIVLTRNEEDIVARCLESVKWADEIIVIDDNSTDSTVEIARRYTDKVIAHPLNGNFSEQRNLGSDRASGDWILQMDADECVTDGLREKVSEILRSGSAISAFRFKRLNNFCGKFLTSGGEGLHRPLRLFRKGKARFSGGRISEELKVDGPTGEIDAVMEHYNFPDIHHYVATQDFYSGMEARALYEKAGLLPEKKLRKELIFGPVKLFFKIYVKRGAYRDGLHGLVFAMLSAWRRFLIYAKYWEDNQEKYK